MVRKISSAIVCIILAGSLSSTFAGRPDKSWKSWFGNVAGGWAYPQSDLGDVAHSDFWLEGGATYWPDDWAVGIDLDLGYTKFDIQGSVIEQINEAIEDANPGTDSDITGIDIENWSTTADIIWGPKTGGSVSFYLKAGVGAYYLKGRTKANGLIYYPPACGGYWYWWCVPGGVAPGTVVTGSESSTEWGYNGGIGVTFEVGTGSQIYLEATYHSIQTDRTNTEYMPVVVGYRW